MLKRATLVPLNLQVIPYPDVEVTMKEEMLPILKSMTRENSTMENISDIQMSPSRHIFGIQPITHK
jgi:hypothetical protein